MKLICAAIFLLVWSHGSAQEQKKAADEKTTADAAKPASDAKPAADAKSSADSTKENPVKPNATSMASGKKTFGQDCAMCHGKEGDGSGDLAVDMKLKLRDYRDAASLKTMTDGDIYVIIEKGKGQMMGEEGRLKPDQIWDVVNYVRSLSKTTATAAH
jgi:mono/diheme cytochrome c family protein